MKKLLIGCGVIALLLVGGVSFVAWKLWPAAQEFMQSLEVVVDSMEELNDDYPYDPELRTDFDVERFADALVLRGALRGEFSDLANQVQALENDEELSFIERTAKGLRLIRTPFTAATTLLTDARMGPAEFVHHMLTYWSAARSAHDGLGDQVALAGVRARYEALADFHEQARQENPELPRLTKLLEPVSPAQTEGARGYLEQHRDVGELSNLDLLVEMMLLQLGNPNQEFVQDFGRVTVTMEPSGKLPELEAPPQEAAEDR